MWPPCNQPHGPAVAKPLWRTLSEDDAIPADAAEAADATVHSEGERSPLPEDGHDGSESSNGGIFDSALRREHDLIPVVAARQQLSDRRLRQGMEGGDGGGGDECYEELNSTSVGLDHVNEVFDGVTSSVDSSDEAAQMYAASRSLSLIHI